MEINPSSEFVVQFWGVRGSIPCPGNETVRYGGNTSCVEMRVGGKRLIFDGGTGLRGLGKSVQQQQPLEAHIFFTHYHWDHIQGVPFFSPAFTPGNLLHIYGLLPPGKESMQQHFWDNVIHIDSLIAEPKIEADLKFYELTYGDTFKIDDITIQTAALNHPNGAIGYRVTWQDHSVFYCTDTEHFPDRMDENVLYLARDADVFIYDSMYTDEEYNNPKSSKVGWGHSTWQQALKISEVANVKQPVIFHHEPNHNDEFMDKLQSDVLAKCPNAVLAREGLIIKIV
jgi:phosphoribosyl 1,2-cyclic phosphodiesterase